MFVSFFPRPRIFFPSAILWTAACVAFWYAFAKPFGLAHGFAYHSGGQSLGLPMFWDPPFLLFDLYFWAAAAGFAAFWRIASPHRWWAWSVLGSALIIFATYIQVEVTVGVTNWYNPFWDMVQAAVSHARVVTAADYYGLILVFLWLTLFAVALLALTSFFTSHWIFRWRTAMNGYYTSEWQRLRGVEGASQRVQDDTQRFAQNIEDLGLSLINSVMTLIAFTPILIKLSARITELPLFGHVPEALLWAGIGWAIFGSVVVALAGIRLPGLQFKNQRVEAAYRKELVYGEDDPGRARPATLSELFSNVRKNYFTLYFHYVYFNLTRYLYIQADNAFGIVVLGPTVIAGAITLGFMQQVLGVFGQVTGSLQYLVSSWSSIIEMQSIFKRLRAFESVLHEEALPAIERSPGAV